MLHFVPFFPCLLLLLLLLSIRTLMPLPVTAVNGGGPCFFLPVGIIGSWLAIGSGYPWQLADCLIALPQVTPGGASKQLSTATAGLIAAALLPHLSH